MVHNVIIMGKNAKKLTTKVFLQPKKYKIYIVEQFYYICRRLRDV